MFDAKARTLCRKCIKRLADVTDKILKISRKKRSLKEQGKHKHTGDCLIEVTVWFDYFHV
jgi:hypothetical protein